MLWLILWQGPQALQFALRVRLELFPILQARTQISSKVKVTLLVGLWICRSFRLLKVRPYQIGWYGQVSVCQVWVKTRLSQFALVFGSHYEKLVPFQVTQQELNFAFKRDKHVWGESDSFEVQELSALSFIKTILSNYCSGATTSDTCSQCFGGAYWSGLGV